MLVDLEPSVPYYTRRENPTSGVYVDRPPGLMAARVIDDESEVRNLCLQRNDASRHQPTQAQSGALLDWNGSTAAERRPAQQFVSSRQLLSNSEDT